MARPTLAVLALTSMLTVPLLTGCIYEGQGEKPTSVRNETDRAVVVRRDGDVTWLIGAGESWEIERPRDADFTQDYEILDAETCVLKEIVTIDTAVAWDSLIILSATGPTRIQLIDRMRLDERPKRTSRTPGLCRELSVPS